MATVTHFNNMSQSHIARYSIRRFLPEDVMLYKGIRLEALRLEAGVFGSSYKRESSFTDEHWLDRIKSNNSGYFGLFYGDQLIGVTAIVIDRDDATLANLTHSYIRKEDRGKGLSRLLYDVRLAWAAERPGIKRLRTGNRESNAASKAANRHYGFRYVMREPSHWPDGGHEDTLYYELIL